MIGDWEAADAWLVAHENLWREALDVLLPLLLPRSIFLISAAPYHGSARVTRLPFGHESAWVRDYGPLQTRAGDSVVWLDAVYDRRRPQDDGVPGRVGRRVGIRVEHAPYRIDGGAIAANGRGLCVMTSRSIERSGVDDTSRMAGQLGCHPLVVIPALTGEPTGHADQVVRFLGPHTVAVGTLEHLRPDGDADRLDRSAMLLEREGLEVVRVPLHRTATGGFFSYVNVVDVGETLMVPHFTRVPDAVQAEAYRVLRRASGKSLLPVPADDIVLAGGGLHCIVLGLHLR